MHMQTFFRSFSLVLFAIIPSFVTCSAIQLHSGHIHSLVLAGRELRATSTFDLKLATTATPCAGADCVGVQPVSDNLPCVESNGTEIVAGSQNNTWTLLCDTDFFAQDIYPFLLVATFEQCLQLCDKYNEEAGQNLCAGFVFAPDRTHLDNDCYLKSAVNDIVYPATIHLIGATVGSKTFGNTIASSTLATIPITPLTTPAITTTTASPTNGTPVIAKVVPMNLALNDHSKQYVDHIPALPAKLAKNLLRPGINTDLITKYPLATDSGSWTSNAMLLESQLMNLSVTPRLSRDGGKGASIDGTHVFIFCDTATFGEEEQGDMGFMNGFVSSSVATAVQDPTDQLRYILSNPTGSWQDEVGRLRAWIEMTTGEEAFNIQLSGKGFRYAVWPQSTPIPLNSTHSLIYAALVYVEVDMKTQAANFTSLGNTLVTVSIDPVYGPHSDRLVNQLFTQDEVAWGTLGGIRGWGGSGNGSMDGSVYLLGQGDKGVLLGRVSPSQITDKTAYQYWDGSEWSSTQQDKSSTAAYFFDEVVADMDIFYSPYHQIFFMFYLSASADNTIWYRWLHLSKPARPPYWPGGDPDYVETILHNRWSDPLVAYRPEKPAIGYIYAGGFHPGYFGQDDITLGGKSLLYTWTEHVEMDPNDPSSGYTLRSVYLTIDWDYMMHNFNTTGSQP